MSIIGKRLSLHKAWENDYPLPYIWKISFNTRSGGTMSTLGGAIDNILSKYERRITSVGQTEGPWPVKINRFDDLSDYSDGFLLASTVAFPSESFQISTVGDEGGGYGGIIPGYVAAARNSYGSQNKLDITFIESNIDIIDYFIKPWIIAVGHKGLIEMGNNDSEDLKCTIDVKLFSRDTDTYGKSFDYTNTSNLRMSLRKQFKFHNAVPFMSEGKEISYSEFTLSDIQKTASFAFSHYTTVEVSNK